MEERVNRSNLQAEENRKWMDELPDVVFDKPNKRFENESSTKDKSTKFRDIAKV